MLVATLKKHPAGRLKAIKRVRKSVESHINTGTVDETAYQSGKKEKE